MRKTLIKMFFILAISLIGRPGFGNSLPISPQYEQRIEGLFFQAGKIDLEKTVSYEQKINKRLHEVRSNIENYLMYVQGRPAHWVLWEANEEYPVRYFHEIKNMLRMMRATTNIIEQKKLAWKILLMESATKVIGSQNKAFFFEDWEKSQFIRFKLKKGFLEQSESSNLKKNEQLYFENLELEELKRRGLELDELALDEKKWFVDNQSTADFTSPEFFELTSVEAYTQRPRFFVKDQSEKKYTIRVGAGIHAEATSSKLLSQLGYHTYPSLVKENVKMKLGKQTLSEFKKQWAEIYTKQNILFEDFVSEIYQDELGVSIVWKRALIQEMPKMDFVGPWSPFENDLMSQREIRSLPLYSIWTDHTRVSEFKGRDLYWQSEAGEDSQQESAYRFYLSELDHSFGSVKGERPGALDWELVLKDKKDSLSFSYKGRGLNEFEMSWSDARWMTQKISALTRQQIQKAVNVGGWPLPIAELLVEKLIERRNQLIEAFELEDKAPKLSVKRNITTKDKSVVNGELVTEHFEGFDQNYGSAFYDIMKPILTAIKDGAFAGGRSLISSFNGMNIEPIEIGVDSSIVYRIIFGFNRTIEPNKEATGANDNYLVKDTFKIGFRLGAGIVVSGDVAYVKEYNLVYPVASKAQGHLQNNFLINFLLPLHVIQDKLPERHVLVLENYLEGRGRIRVGSGFTGIGTFLSVSQVNLSRTYISRSREDKAYIFEDNSLFTELAYRINLELGAIGIPVFKTHLRQGKLERNYYVLDLQKAQHQKALNQSLKFGSNSAIRETGAVHKIDNKFLETQSNFNLFGLIRAETRTRYDDIIEQHIDDPGPGQYVLIRRYQLEQLKRNSWNIGLTGEEQTSRVILTGKPPLENNLGRGLESIQDPYIQIILAMNDKTTKTSELERYISMINEMALDKNFINFTPALHSRNNLWGETETFVTFNIYENGIQKLIDSNEEVFWRSLAIVTEKPESYWARALSTNLRNRRHMDVTNRDSFLAAKVKSMARHFRNAAKEKNSLSRMRSIHSALSQSVYSSDRAFRATILAMIHKIIGKENIHMTAFIGVPEDQENTFPGQIPLTNEMGVEQDVDELFYQFIFEDASDIYNAFKF